MNASAWRWLRKGMISVATLGIAAAYCPMAYGANPVTLKVMRAGYPTEARAFFTEVQKGLAKEYPDIKLEIVDADWNTFHSRLPIWVTGKQEPDVYLCSATDLAAIVDIGGVIPLDEFVDAKLRAPRLSRRTAVACFCRNGCFNRRSLRRSGRPSFAETTILPYSRLSRRSR